LKLGLVSDDMRSYILKRIAARIGGAPPKKLETQFKCKDGSWIWVSLEDAIIRKSGVPVGFQIIASDITKRKLAEQKLKESEEKFKYLVKNSYDVFVIIDENGRETYVSESVELITGFSPAEIMGHPGFEFLHPDDIDHMSKTLSKLLDTPGETIRDEYRHQRKGGGWVYLEAIGTNYLQEPVIKGIVLNVRDITERKQAEKNLANREAELRSLLNGLNDSVYAVDTDFGYIFVNDAHLSHMVDSGHISQKRSEKIIGKRYQDFHPEKESNEFIENIRKVCKTGKSIQYEFKWPGIERWSSRVLSPIYELETGIVNNVSVISRDITERKQKEDALKENEERYRQIFQFSPDSIIIHDMDMNILDANNKAIEEFGYSKTELLKKTIFELHPETELKHSAQVLVAMNNKELLNVETKFVRKDGSVFFAEATPCKYTLGSKPVIHVVIRDITEQMQLEAEKQQLESKFRESQKMESIGNLAGGIAHDFNNLLTVIQGNAQIAMMAMDESNPQYKNLTQIMNSSTRAASLTRQLLLFSRKQTVELKTLELNQTIQNLLKMLQRLIGENIVIETELATDLSNIEADEGNIEQVIMNLAVNARDAMPDGGKLTFLTENISIPDDEQSMLQDSRAGDFVRISVQDTGCGIPKELLSKIFEPFFSTKEKGKGTGLGLSVVYGIVKNHNGWINAYSEPQQGTAFKIYLPVSVSLLQEENTIKTESAESLHGNGEQILVIEDEQGILDFASSALRQFGYTIRVASNGHQALSVFEEAKGNFQLIISDVILPDINGFDLVTKLTKEYPDIPVIMCSGYTEERVKQSIIKEKGFRFLQKPYSMNALLEMVKKDIRKSGQ